MFKNRSQQIEVCRILASFLRLDYGKLINATGVTGAVLDALEKDETPVADRVILKTILWVWNPMNPGPCFGEFSFLDKHWCRVIGQLFQAASMHDVETIDNWIYAHRIH